MEQVAGGVGRNIADALGKLTSLHTSHSEQPFFISALGADQFGTFLLQGLQHLNHEGVEVKKAERTGCCSVLLNSQGDTSLLVGDMTIHDTITSQQVSRYISSIRECPLLILDANLSQSTIEYCLELAGQHSTFVWFEPTDISKADRAFRSDLWKRSLTFITPNISELRVISKAIGVDTDEELRLDNVDQLLKQLVHLAYPLALHIPIVMVTMGVRGILMLSRVNANDVLRESFKFSNSIQARYYPPHSITEVINTSGAGDCTGAGFVMGLLVGLTEPQCVQVALRAGGEALRSKTPVPDSFSSRTLLLSQSAAEFVLVQ